MLIRPLEGDNVGVVEERPPLDAEVIHGESLGAHGVPDTLVVVRRDSGHEEEERERCGGRELHRRSKANRDEIRDLPQRQNCARIFCTCRRSLEVPADRLC